MKDEFKNKEKTHLLKEGGIKQHTQQKRYNIVYCINEKEINEQCYTINLNRLLPDWLVLRQWASLGNRKCSLPFWWTVGPLHLNISSKAKALVFALKNRPRYRH